MKKVLVKQDQTIKRIESLKRKYPEVFEAYRGNVDDELVDVDAEYLREARARARREMVRNVEVLVDLREKLSKEKGRERDALRAIVAMFDIATGEVKGKDDDKVKYNVNMLVQVLTGGK